MTIPKVASSKRPATRRANAPLPPFALAPIKLIMAFSLGTYLTFVLGPWEFPMQGSYRLAVAVLAFNLAMYVGFRSGVSAQNSTQNKTPKQVISSRHIDRILYGAFWITLLTFFPRFVIATQNYGLDPGVFIEKVSTGLTDAYEVYTERFVTEPPGIWRFINYASVATGFIAWLYTPLSLLLWHRLTIAARVATVMLWLGAVTASVARGQNFGAFDLAIQLLTYGLIRFIALPAARGVRAVSWMRVAVVLATALTAVSAFFANTMRSRIGDQYDSLIYVNGAWIPLGVNGWVWQLTPDALKPLVASLTSYVAHGYSALGMSLDLPFDTTYGLGNSYFLVQSAYRFLGLDVFPSTYQYKLYVAEGYDPTVLWHTAYLWIANDVSLWGVPVFLFALFHIFGRAWLDLISKGNLFAGLLMAPMAIFTAFISATNQLTSNPNVIMGFGVALVAWMYTSGRFRWDPGVTLPASRDEDE